LLCGLPRHYHPVFKSERFARATDDRFFLVIESRDPKFYRDDARALLESLDPLSVEALED
ncbi:MAG: quinol:electron acceptor oxidoreductase subunit ActD, partial [Planctomycetota bacterium]